jgi:hypothetical protein
MGAGCSVDRWGLVAEGAVPSAVVVVRPQRGPQDSQTTWINQLGSGQSGLPRREGVGDDDLVDRVVAPRDLALDGVLGVVIHNRWGRLDDGTRARPPQSTGTSGMSHTTAATTNKATATAVTKLTTIRWVVEVSSARSLT